MFDHVTIRVSDRAASERFYRTVLRTLGIEPTYEGEELIEWDDFSLAAGGPVTRGLHIGFAAPSQAEVDTSTRFYETIAPHAGFERVRRVKPEHAQVVGEKSTFSPLAGRPTAHVHLAFPARDNAAVEAFHRAGTEVGYRDNGAPGERAEYHRGYYGAYVLDPDGHNVEVVNHNR